MTEAARTAEQAARASYGKLLAILAKRTSDISAAEDALADAFAKALSHWPENGIPAKPEAWLLTAARNRLTDQQRRAVRFSTTNEVSDMAADVVSSPEHPDDRLALMFVCAHPAIAPDLHTPLMLQCVLGFEAGDIARAFLVSPAAMAQRLVRAKRKILDAKIPFVIPDAGALPSRLEAIYEAIYAAHALDWLAPSDAMGDEALYLADLLARQRPDDPEALGLAALIAFTHARNDARVENGVLVPIHEQDTDLWHGRLISYALDALNRAQKLGRPGRYQIEAAIQSVHIHRRDTGRTDWASLSRLYEALIRLYPTVGTAVARAAVLGELHGPETGLAALDRIDAEAIETHQPAWATRAELLSRAGRTDEAAIAFDQAISMTAEEPLWQYLEVRRRNLEK